GAHLRAQDEVVRDHPGVVVEGAPRLEAQQEPPASRVDQQGALARLEGTSHGRAAGAAEPYSSSGRTSSESSRPIWAAWSSPARPSSANRSPRIWARALQKAQKRPVVGCPQRSHEARSSAFSLLNSGAARSR